MVALLSFISDLSEERRELYALWHKQGGKLSETYEKLEYFKRIARFSQAILSNHELITHIALF